MPALLIVALVAVVLGVMGGSGFLLFRTQRTLAEERAARRRMEAAGSETRETVERYRQMFEQNQAIQLIVEQDTGAIVEGNRAACAFYGYPAEKLCSMTMQDLSAQEEHEVAREMRRAVVEKRAYHVFQHRLANGVIRTVEVHSSPIEIPGRALLYSIIHDVTDRVQFEQQLQHLALHDALTALPNRALLLDRLEQALLIARRRHHPFSLLLMDLNQFKEINDTFGHQAGDQLLTEVGNRVQSMLRDSDTVARLGGDEFAVVLPGTDAQGAEHVALKMAQALDDSIDLAGVRLHISGSIGIAVFPDHGDDADTILRHADIAMYVAKRTNRSFAVYAADDDEYTPARMELVGELRDALEARQFVLHYQPKVHCASGRVGEVEALLRWQHPKRGLLGPDKFIPLAEQIGLIDTLTIHVLELTVEQCRRWRDQGMNLRIAANISAYNLSDKELIHTIDGLLRQHDVPVTSLSVEVTESAVMSDVGRAMSILTKLSGMGVAIAIDDFGTGYSSLAYLRRLPVDEIKIDRSFVMDMHANEEDATIVRSVIDLGHNLGLNAVAEGVEGIDTMRMLQGMGCDLAQGYYLSRPLPASELLMWVLASNGGVGALQPAPLAASAAGSTGTILLP